MQVSVDITDEIRREAITRELPLVDFVEMLISRGMETLHDRGTLDSAIDRIRALRSSPPPAQS